MIIDDRTLLLCIIYVWIITASIWSKHFCLPRQIWNKTPHFDVNILALQVTHQAKILIIFTHNSIFTYIIIQIELRVTLDIYHVQKYGVESDLSWFHYGDYVLRLKRITYAITTWIWRAVFLLTPSVAWLCLGFDNVSGELFWVVESDKLVKPQHEK